MIGYEDHTAYMHYYARFWLYLSTYFVPEIQVQKHKLVIYVGHKMTKKLKSLT